MSILSDFQTFFRFQCRGIGNTYALIGTMRTDHRIVMLVPAAHFGDALSKQYNIPRNRFISIRNGVRELRGRLMCGPVLVDLPAVTDILDQVELQHIDETKKLNEKIKLLMELQHIDETKKLNEEIKLLKSELRNNQRSREILAEENAELTQELLSKTFSIMNLECGTMCLNARVGDRDKEIIELKAENQRLQNVIANATNALNHGVQQKTSKKPWHHNSGNKEDASFWQRDRPDERFLRKNV